MPAYKPAPERFLDKFDVNPETLCWEWNGGMDGRGYGRLKTGRKYTAAHRFSYTMFYGHIRVGLFVCHHCDNPPCVNPDHLFLGDNQDNMQDAARKGRIASGPRHWTHAQPERVPRGESYQPRDCHKKEVG